MAKKIWILDTDTKGTGAQMVPLDKAEEKRAAEGRGVVVAPDHSERKPEKPRKPRGPRRFKVVDVMTRATLAEDAGARETVDLLKGVRSMVDVSVYVWEDDAGAWQQLTQREQRMLWDRAVAERD
jgi:hypothetical protein